MTNVETQKAAREEIQMLTFALDKVCYGVNVHQVREVKNFEGVTPVPYAPAYVKGVTNLRGEVIPVIDLRRRFGMVDPKDAEDAGIMVIVQDKHPVGVMVDSVMEVVTLSSKDIEANPENFAMERSDAVLGVAKHDNDLIIMIDLMKVISRSELEKHRGFEVETNRAPEQAT
jgi:purine-binding chemotaxis protein CheW